MPPVSLYIHVPFCAHKCPYCDFNAYAGLGRLIEPFVDAVQREVRNWSDLLAGHEIRTVSFGGGTPSLLSAGQVASVLETCARAFRLAGDLEVSLEANPGTLTPDKLHGYRAAGVNRLSLGVQSFDTVELRWLGRDHGVPQVEEAVVAARSAGFDNLNLDLIYGLPGQTMGAWQANLQAALALNPDHLSCYALTVEDATPLARSVAAGRTQAPDPDEAADHYELTEDVLEAGGFEHYEISNWARPGKQSRHNVTYWLNEPYVGLGPGAHSYFGGFRFSNVRSPGTYNAALRALPGRHHGLQAASPLAELERVDASVDLFDTLTQRLRLVRDGVDLDGLISRHGALPVHLLERVFVQLVEQGLLESAGRRLRLTRRGRLLSNEVFLALLQELQSQPGYAEGGGAETFVTGDDARSDPGSSPQLSRPVGER